MMFRHLLIAAVVALLSMSRVQAADGNAYIGAGVGRSSIDSDGLSAHDTGWDLVGGYRWNVAPSGQLGIEAGYTDLGTFTFDSISGVRSRLHGWTLGGSARFEVAPSWYFVGRAGYFRADVEADGLYLAPLRDTLDTWYAGVGVDYAIDPHFSIGLGYDYHRADAHGFKPDPDSVSVHAEYRF